MHERVDGPIIAGRWQIVDIRYEQKANGRKPLTLPPACGRIKTAWSQSDDAGRTGTVP